MMLLDNLCVKRVVESLSKVLVGMFHMQSCKFVITANTTQFYF